VNDTPTVNDTPAANDIPVVIDATAVHPQSGGAGTYLRSLVKALPSAGVSPIVIARRNDTFEWPGAATVHRVAPNGRAQRLVWEQTSLARVVQRLVPVGSVVLHSPHYTAPRRLPTRVKSVVTIHDLTFFSRPADHSRVKRLMFRTAIRRSAKHAHEIVAVSYATAKAYSDVTGRHDRVVVAQHGVDHARFFPDPMLGAADRTRDQASLTRLGVMKPFVLFLGTIEPRKQVDALINAFTKLSVSNLDVQLVLAGQFWPGMNAALPPVGQRELRLGFVSDVDAVALLRHAAVVCYPSAEEGFGLPLLEAMACGAAVVAAASDVSIEVCGDAANLVPLLPSASFAARLSVAIDEFFGGSSSGGQGIQRSLLFSWERSAQDHVRAYRLAATGTSEQ
jgi:glycosyltransferase involved in cell wall biosynthesis